MSLAFAPPQTPATPQPDLDRLARRLHDQAPVFARTGIAERLALLRTMLEGYLGVAEEQVRAGCRVKGIDFNSPAAAEEWLGGPSFVLRNIRLLIETLERLQAGRPPIDPGRVRTRADGRVVVDVFPTSTLDRLLFGGFTGEVWMQPGVTAADVPARAGAHYRLPAEKRPGRVVLVLGAGNVASIPPLDVLHKMFVEGKACLLKMNPVNAHVGPFVERAFAAAVERGFLAVTYGGAEVGAYLVDHPLIDEVHITGSDKTHDLLVWGPPGPEREARKARHEPRIQKEVTSELGNVSPVIVVPGPYTEAELAFQAESIGAAVTNNASFNCNAAKMLVQPRGWEGGPRLLRSLSAALRLTPLRRAYYPGAEARWRELVESHPQSERLGEPREGELPWALIPRLDPERKDEACFRVEPFCGVISETEVGSSSDPVAFLEEAVRFANHRLWGTLSATLVVHPKTLDDPRAARAVDRAIADLRYGAVGINHWPALAYGFMSTPWGAHPSSTLEDIQSGRGFVHNTYMLEDIEKCVIRGPLVARPKPVWFASHRRAHEVGRRMVAMEAHPSWAKLPGLVLSAVRG
jgi:acyl-CoA reductase-like NAD-dependent aldehyde dehydrogenase